MILHVAKLEKFLPSFVELIRQEFDFSKHKFWFSGENDSFSLRRENGLYICGKSGINQLIGYIRLIVQLHKARKVILHGLFNSRVVFVLALCPWLINKCYWVIWGGDLYHYQKVNRTIGSRLYERLRRRVIRKIGHLVTYIPGDIELARQWYGAKGSYHECLMYLSNVVDPRIVRNSAVKFERNETKILVGNSADPSNNHIQSLEQLLPFKDQRIRIFVPLSYGSESHAQKVISQGKKWFGDKFVPMLDFMPADQYQEFLKSIDIAVFNHKRQQAMGNTITLLGMGKTVFMRSDVSQWEFFQNSGIKVLDVERLAIKKLEVEIIATNKKLVAQKFSRASLIEQYNRIFNS